MRRGFIHGAGGALFRPENHPFRFGGVGGGSSPYGTWTDLNADVTAENNGLTRSTGVSGWIPAGRTVETIDPNTQNLEVRYTVPADNIGYPFMVQVADSTIAIGTSYFVTASSDTVFSAYCNEATPGSTSEINFYQDNIPRETPTALVAGDVVSVRVYNGRIQGLLNDTVLHTFDFNNGEMPASVGARWSIKAAATIAFPNIEVNITSREQPWGTWTDLGTNVTAENNGLTRSSGTGWVQGGRTTETGGDGARIEIVPTLANEAEKGMIQLMDSTDPTGTSYFNGQTDGTFSLYLNSGVMDFYHETTKVGVSGTYTSADLLAVRLNGGNIEALKNGVVVHTFIPTVATPSSVCGRVALRDTALPMSFKNIGIFNMS